jgi:hypothetical protein
MSDYFHDGAFVFELLKFVLFDDLALDFFDGDDCVLPSATVDDTVAAL